MSTWMLVAVAVVVVLVLVVLLFPATTVRVAGGRVVEPTIVGTWTKSTHLPDGRSLAVWMRLDNDGAYSGHAIVEGQRVWDFSGSWKLDGKVLQYVYEQSSRLLQPSEKTDEDEVIAVDEGTLHLRSRKTGFEHLFFRED